MYPATYAAKTPDRAAAINGRTGEILTFKQLNDRSNQLAQYWYGQGLRRGDHVAIFMENNLKYFEVAWAALRSGLYITTINRYLTAEEAAYIIGDCAAKSIVTSLALQGVATELSGIIPDCPMRLMVNGVIDAWDSYEEIIAAQPATPLAEEPMGDAMLYSSGTTGRPKGIKRPLGEGQSAAEGTRLTAGLQALYGFDENSVYLSPAPLYHSAPFGFTNAALSLGSTVIMMEKFDAQDALRLIEKHRITHSQWVPTMFVRMFKLPEEERLNYDLSSHKVAIHAAAPCPVEVKRTLIEWWGPIIYEYYAGTEGNGSTFIASEAWMQHPGSVGQPVNCEIRICDEAGAEQPTGEPGIVYFVQDAMLFEYHGAPEKTRDAQHPTNPNWSTLGDVGYLDEEGYLYLTDRKSFMIISGGVNIYPQEIENQIVLHPKVEDVAVFGVPHPEFGEEVKAVVQPATGVEVNEALAQELIAYTREHLAHYKTPKSVDFLDELPRLPTGKLYKRILRDKYWGKHDTKIV